MKKTPFRFCLVTDRTLCGRKFGEIIEKAVEGGVDAVQVREKDLGAGELYDLTLEVKSVAGTSAKVIINDRIDVAMALQVDGIHLGWKALPVNEARRITSQYSMLVGASCHTIMDAMIAEREGADYITFGPVFNTPSKEGLVAPCGVEAITEVKKNVSVPVIAIGGIDAGNCRKLIDAGADGIAVIRAVLCAEDPYKEAQKIKNIIF